MIKQIEKGNLPQHIAVIMDGNGRWAKQQGAARIFGHRNAIKAIRDITEGCSELGINYLTLYAFSTENWSRPKQEVQGLMTLLVTTIKDELPNLMENDVRLDAIGDLSRLPENAQKKLQQAKEATCNNSRLNLILALNYSGRWDLEEAMKKIAVEVDEDRLMPHQINSETITKHLSTSRFPDPELLIRTSGEMRISNFLLWQMAYTELYFTDILWPDFRKEHLHKALAAYQKRERRFGKISEQVNL